MKTTLILATFLSTLGQLHAADDGITWLIHYDGKSLPAAPWTAIGNPDAKVEADGLRLVDGDKEFAHYRAPWKAGADDEIIVEATVKTGAIPDRSRRSPRNPYGHGAMAHR